MTKRMADAIFPLADDVMMSMLLGIENVVERENWSDDDAVTIPEDEPSEDDAVERTELDFNDVLMVTPVSNVDDVEEVSSDLKDVLMVKPVSNADDVEAVTFGDGMIAMTRPTCSLVKAAFKKTRDPVMFPANGRSIFSGARDPTLKGYVWVWVNAVLV